MTLGHPGARRLSPHRQNKPPRPSSPPKDAAAKAGKPAKPDARVAAAEAKPLCVRAVGKAETGTAAWYGGRYVGRRTSSGERLDTIHATAAHRTLPLNSLARVTNLDNGRSVVVRVTDRGPVSESLLIDMSPRAADELHMKEAGLVPVRVEQVVEVPPDSQVKAPKPPEFPPRSPDRCGRWAAASRAEPNKTAGFAACLVFATVTEKQRPRGKANSAPRLN